MGGAGAHGRCVSISVAMKITLIGHRLGVAVVLAAAGYAQPRGQPTPEERQRLQELTTADHRAMLGQLGITKLRPGPNGRAAAGEPNAANYDPAKANPYPDYPDALTLRSGEKVATAEG